MKLTTEAQRKLLLDLLSEVPIRGATIGTAYQGAEALSPEVRALIEEIRAAEIEGKE